MRFIEHSMQDSLPRALAAAQAAVQLFLPNPSRPG